MSVNSEKAFFSGRPSKLNEEEKEDRQDAFPRPSFRKSGSLGQNQIKSLQVNQNATLSLTNPFPQAPIPGEQELFVNNAGESLPALKAQ